MGLLKKIASGKNALNQAVQSSGNIIELSNDLLLQLQQTLTEMYLDLKSACDKHGCKAFLCGGSALGAIRHGGFIPWDDDFDVAMSRSDYEKLKVFFDEELGNRYILNAPDISETPITRFPKILKKNTKLVKYGENYREEIDLVYIDVFLIDDIPNSKIMRNVRGLWVNFCEFASAQVEYKNFWKTAKKQYYLKLGAVYAYTRLAMGTLLSVIPYKSWLKMIDKAICYHNENCKYKGLTTGRYHYFGEILPNDVFFPGKVIKFGGHDVDVFQDLEKYLINLYGEDYMTPPPPDKREHHFITEIKF